MEDISQILFSYNPEMMGIKAVIDEVSSADIPVLIKGEEGTGKELIAKIIHLNSTRKGKPFVKVNCAGLHKTIIESEIFGFEKNPLMGIHTNKPGKIEIANGGTLLINEISEMDMSTQAKILQVIQDKVFSRVGGEKDIKVDTRIIATTKNHIESSILEGRFMEDLFFKLNVINITIPPLRNRKEQIPHLSKFYFDYYKKKFKKEKAILSNKLLKAIEEYTWPGNIRELEDTIKQVVLDRSEDEIIKQIKRYRPQDSEKKENREIDLYKEIRENFNLKEIGKRAAEEAEKEIIRATLNETRWNRKNAAKLLNISYKALLYKIQKYRME